MNFRGNKVHVGNPILKYKKFLQIKMTIKVESCQMQTIRQSEPEMVATTPGFKLKFAMKHNLLPNQVLILNSARRRSSVQCKGCELRDDKWKSKKEEKWNDREARNKQTIYGLKLKF